jgi:Nuclease-related domain/UvrD-like helicase C-terminal domain/Type III restriction enzyme, res subunit
MARMIPPRVVPTHSPGESDIFKRLRDDPATADWIVLHSLDIARHRSQISGEADFLVIIPNKGILVVEVKSCSRLRREGGLWYLGSQPGELRGPFRQASEAMHSLREQLAKRRADLSRVPFWSCVIFTHMVFREKSGEWHSWQVIDSQGLRSAPLGRLLRDLIDHARAHLASSPGASFHPESKEPYKEQCEELAQFFRPDFECFQDYKAIAASINAEIQKYTDEQLSALDAMETNPRVVFKGPAGTGKTVLAVEAARRAASSSNRVLLLCYNKLLGANLAKQCETVAPQIRARTLHAHMLEIAGAGPASVHQDNEYWQSGLPAKAVDTLLAQGGSEYVFDEIIVDEAQDILKASYLDFLDLSILGGLSAGKWRFFGDFEKQAIYGSANLSLGDLYARLSEPPPEYSLRINCRNTPSVATLAQLLGGLSPGYTRVLRPYDGIEPQYQFYSNHAEQPKLLERALERLYADGLSGSDIVILSPRADSLAAAGLVENPPWKQRIKTFGSGEDGYIHYCSIHAFKGLEAPAVIVTDLDNPDREFFESLIYIAVTRSVHRLVVIIHDSLRPVLISPASN